MSKAFDRSICKRTVLSGGLFLLKPSDTALEKSCRADTQECSLLKPCWMSGIGRDSVREGRMSRSRIFMAGQRRETGRYEVDSSAGLFGFSRGIIIDVFQMAGMELVLIERLKIVVRYRRPWSPRCFRCSVEILSGPMALDALAFFMASLVAEKEKSWWSLQLLRLISFVRDLAVLLLLCLITEEYWMLKDEAMSFGLEIYLPLNLIDWFSLAWALPFRCLISLKSLLESFFLSIFSTVFLHFSFLCWSISVLISLFKMGMLGEVGSLFLRVSLSLILLAVDCGISL